MVSWHKNSRMGTKEGGGGEGRKNKLAKCKTCTQIMCLQYWQGNHTSSGPCGQNNDMGNLHQSLFTKSLGMHMLLWGTGWNVQHCPPHPKDYVGCPRGLWVLLTCSPVWQKEQWELIFRTQHKNPILKGALSQEFCFFQLHSSLKSLPGTFTRSQYAQMD